ncbi:uncharacterized protein PHALS_12646 [Plasmopara halstedii]|uniref:Uncharacterized protein n=1 Tax=Plasmopara halstedii TaxID=4781 RepID=A0A0P1ANQ7_PLAHL|nr:uncharacterized protein PHALS_12646 [Plasmopara halstedii]CEG42365.1 hypothetical protein PHALS_12646 [Plasmopara halstedii]|eukprot:XP_024578734.1 hypothetical protein PHALS_12646 [Plasmopara halstedii]
MMVTQAAGLKTSAITLSRGFVVFMLSATMSSVIQAFLDLAPAEKFEKVIA